MDVYELGSHSWVILLVKWCCTVHTAVGCSFSPHVGFILFVYHCEVCNRIQLRTWILRYCISVGGMMLFSHVCCLCHLYSIQNRIGRYELIQMADMEWHVFQWIKGIRFYYKGPHPLLWAAGSRVARGKIKSGVRHQLDYAHGLETHAINETAR